METLRPGHVVWVTDEIEKHFDPPAERYADATVLTSEREAIGPGPMDFTVVITTDLGVLRARAGASLWRHQTVREDTGELFGTVFTWILLLCGGVLGLYVVLSIFGPRSPEPPTCTGTAEQCDPIFDDYVQQQEDMRP